MRHPHGIAAAVLPAVLLAVLLGACAVVPAPGGSAVGAGPRDTSRTLRILGDADHLPAAVAEFRRRHPELDVKYTRGGVSFEDGSAQALLRSGRSPDVLLVNSGPSRVGQAADAKLIAPLDGVLAARGILDRYPATVRTQTENAKDGRSYEVVEGLDVFTVHYNEKLFAAHGVEVPATFGDLLSACTKLRAAGVEPLALGVRDNFGGGWLLGTLVQAAAGRSRVHDVLFGRDAFDQPQLVEGARMLARMVDAGCIEPRQAAALDSAQAQAAFWRGDAAMTVMGQGPAVQEARDGRDVSRFGTFAMPPERAGTPRLATAGLATSWIVGDSTTSIGAVGDWLDWVSSPDYLRLSARNGATLVPARTVPAGVTLAPSVRDATATFARGTGYNPSVYLPGSAKDAWYEAVQGVVSGARRPEQAMAGVQKALAESRGD